MVAGHSLGEYSALVAAGALTLADAAPLVRFRAQAMQEAVPVGAGAMAAILGLDAHEGRSPAAPRRCAAAPTRRGGRSGQLQRPGADRDRRQQGRRSSKALRSCSRRTGAKRALLLPVSAPFHSSLMKPAAEKLARAPGADVRFAAPQIPVVNNIDVAGRDRPGRDPRRARTPGVRAGALGRDACRRSGRAASRTIVECGPGKVLAGTGQAHRRRR